MRALAILLILLLSACALPLEENFPNLAQANKPTPKDTVVELSKQIKALCIEPVYAAYFAKTFCTPSELTLAMMSDRIVGLSKVSKPKSVKIHSFYLNRPDIVDWVNSQNATVVFLERRDKLKAFKSLAIAYTLNAWMIPITASSVTVDMDMVVNLYNRVIDPNVESNKNKLKHKIQTAYYEDLMLENKLVSSNPPAQKQNTTDVTIENWNQIHEYMLSINLI